MSAKKTYKDGLRYYENNHIKSVECGNLDPYDSIFQDSGLCIRITVAHKQADGITYTTHIHDNGQVRCNCRYASVCEHIVAAMFHIRDNLNSILSQRVANLPSLRREYEKRQDAAEAAADLKPHDPAADFDVWLRDEKFNRVAALRNLKEYVAERALMLKRLVRDEKPRECIDASKSVFVTYLEYLHTLMLDHADTMRKRSPYLKFLREEYTRNRRMADIGDPYRQCLARLYKMDAEWRKLVISTLERNLKGDDDDDGWGFGRPVYAIDVLPYTGVLEAAGEDASKIFERYHEESATICHEYFRYLVRVKKRAKAKRVKQECCKRFGDKTSEPHDDEYGW